MNEDAFIYPKQEDRDRQDRYAHYDKFYNGNHFDAFAIKGEKNFTERYKRLRYIAAPFAGLMSRTMADMMFGEPMRIDMNDKNNQLFVDALFQKNQLPTQLYESELVNSRRGDSLFKIRVGQRNPQAIGSDVEIIIEEVTAAIYMPELNQSGSRYTPSKEVLATTFEREGNTYLHKEVQVPGFIFNEVYMYDPQSHKIIAEMNPESFGYAKMQETNIKNRTLLFHVPNIRDGFGYFGTSDYADLEPLFFALNNRLTMTDNILDRHSDPILAVPPGVIDENGNVNKSALQMFEVDNENPGFNKPEYIVWNANLESAFKEIDKLIEMLFLFSEVSPAGTPADKAGGQAESGRALKFRLLSSIRKKNRKIRYYDQAIKDMVETAIELAIANGIKIDGLKPSKVERPKIKWPDGIINDEVEQTNMAVTRVDAGLSSRADEIAKLDDISPEEAKKKVAEIDEENDPKVPAIGDTTPTDHPQDNNQPNPPIQPTPPTQAR